MKKYKNILWGLFSIAAIVASSFDFGIADGLILAMATPAAVAGQYSEVYVSMQEINMPKWYHTLVRRFGDQGAEMVGMCQALGWTDYSDVQKIQHYEDDWIWDSFKVSAQGGGGATATITIDPSSIYNGAFYPGVKDLIEFPVKDGSGNPIQAYITAIGANTIDVRVAKSTWTIPATSNGQTLIVMTNLSGEGTGQPAPKVRRFNHYENTFAIVKTSVDWTGSEATDTLKFDNYNGKNITGVVDLASLELDMRQMKAEQGLFLSGQKYDGITDGGKSVIGTEGMFAALKRSGIQYGFTTVGMSTFDVLEKALSKVYAGQISGVLQGIDLDIAVENIFADYLKHTNVNFATKEVNTELFGDAESANAIAVGFDVVKKAKRKYAFKRFGALNDPQQYGAEGYDYTRRGVVMPLSNKNIDPKTKAKIPTMRTLYRQKGTYSRQKEMFWTGSADAARYGNTNDIDARELNCRTQMGAEFFATNQWVDLFPSA